MNTLHMLHSETRTFLITRKIPYRMVEHENMDKVQLDPLAKIAMFTPHKLLLLVQTRGSGWMGRGGFLNFLDHFLYSIYILPIIQFII